MASKFTEGLAKRSKKQKQQYSPSNPTTTTTMYHLIIDNDTNQKMIVGNSSVKRLDSDGTVKLNNGRKAQLIFSGNIFIIPCNKTCTLITGYFHICRNKRCMYAKME